MWDMFTDVQENLQIENAFIKRLLWEGIKELHKTKEYRRERDIS